MTTAVQNGSKWLADAGLRPTRQRLALATLLVGDGQNRHVTAESLYADAKAGGESVSLATVYNTLRAFCDSGQMMRSGRSSPARVASIARPKCFHT